MNATKHSGTTARGALAPLLTPHGRLTLGPAGDAPVFPVDLSDRLMESFARGSGRLLAATDAVPFQIERLTEDVARPPPRGAARSLMADLSYTPITNTSYDY